MIITVKVSEKESYKCELREPEFEELAHALALMSMEGGRVNLGRAGRFIIESCWVSGDKKIKTDAKILLSASLEAAELIEIFETEIKKK